jgi:hypothetical protein
MGNTNPKGCDYGGGEGPAITTNAFLNIFGMGSLVDPVGCVSQQIGEIEAQKRAYLDQQTVEMFEQNLVIATKSINLTAVSIEYNKSVSEYLYEMTNGKYNTIQATLPMVVILVFILYFYIITLPLPKNK